MNKGRMNKKRRNQKGINVITKFKIMIILEMNKNHMIKWTTSVLKY